MLGLDFDVGPAVARLAEDPMIGWLVRARPGIRVPGAWGPLEVAIHAIVVQHCTLARAAERMGSLVRNFGQPVPGLAHGLTHLFPSADVLAGADLAAIDLPRATAQAVQALAGGVATGHVVLDGSLGLADLVASLTGIPGIGPTAAHQVALRLGQRDAFPESDPSICWALRSLDCPTPAEEIASRWHPWRALAATHLLTYAASASTPPQI
jgi:AraC family transcriptional regulator of adaptative response / DNA-3-methyladenine glycosylase II